MLEKLRENKRLVAIIFGAIVITVLVIIFLIVVTRPSNNTPPPATGGNNNGGSTGNNGGNNGNNNDGSTEEVTLEWWGAFLTADNVKPLIDKYEADNPGVNIAFTNQVIKQSEVTGYQTKLTDVLGGNTVDGPDIVMVDNGWAGMFQAESAPAPENIITGSQVDTNFYKFVTTDFVKDDQVFGLPLWVDTYALVYNKDMYEEANIVSPDSDWQKFVDEQLPDLTKVENDKITRAGFAGAETKNTEFWFEAINILFFQNKVDVVGVDGKATFGSDSDAEDAVTFYKQFSEGNTAWNDTFNLDVAAFLEKKLATYLAPTWRLNDIVRYNEVGNLDLDIGISALPQLSSSSSDKANMATYWANSVNKDSADSAEAWKFINFLTQPEQLELLNDSLLAQEARSIGVLYPRKDMASKQASDSYLGVYVNSLPDAKSWPMKNKIAIKDEFAAILNSNESLKKTEEDVNKIL